MKKGEISKKILKGLLFAGGFYIACSSPRFARRAIPELFKYLKYKAENKKKMQAYRRSFYYLWRNKMIDIEYRGKQMRVSLSKEGKKIAGKYHIDGLRIPKPKKWDGWWRILIFDIPDKNKVKREALRGKLKELGLFKLQKSVWVCPYNFQNEVEILRNFFAFKKDELQVIIASVIENDAETRNFFKL
ncbi:MAG: CRISPR-associated endonuclease Cas2 [Patescibacteria group bacterium]|nr:CRISPR-associated endonuclease Cas2 [Patescibacteria group bacterium]